MKRNLAKALALMVTVLLFSCEKNETPEGNKIETKSNLQQKTNATSAVASCAPVYALVLSGSSSSPIPGGFSSNIFKVDLCASPTAYTFVSQIKIGGTPVQSVTGLCNMPGVVDFAWAVTGINSNFPSRILKVHIPTGNATIAAASAVPLQDIENYLATGLFVAIKEGTSQLMKVNPSTGACAVFAPVGPTSQYTGLTVVGNKFHAISGNTNLVCGPTYGDIFEYTTAGGAYIAKYSYKNLAANPSWTMKELGFHYDNCCGKRWTVGSALGIISHNIDVTPCVLPNPTFLLNTTTTGQNYWYIYDFMEKV